jgi:hypothetical protein
METKKCNKCGEVKELLYFGKKTKDRISTICKICTNLRLNARRRQRCKEDEVYRKKCNRDDYERRKKKMLTDEVYRKKQMIKKTEKLKRKRFVDDDFRIKHNRKRTERRKKQRKTDNDYRLKHNRKITEKMKKRYYSDPIYKLRKDISRNLRQMFKNKGETKKEKTHEILGIPLKDFYDYIQSLFVEEMSWENRGKWHIDHIVPISLGETREEIIYLNHYTNLRPLWANDNLSKSDKIDDSNIDMYNKFLKDMRGV